MKSSPKGYVPAQNFLGPQLSRLSQFHCKKYAQKYYEKKKKIVDVNQIPITITKDSSKISSVLTASNSPVDSNENSSVEVSFQRRNDKKANDKMPEWFFTPKSKQNVRAMFKLLEYNPLMYVLLYMFCIITIIDRDSSNMSYKDWVKIALDIELNYHLYDAFIVLHGTDTMAYTTSALSFMLEGLRKTVIVTGSQIPISQTRNDGFDNLLGSITIAMVILIFSFVNCLLAL